MALAAEIASRVDKFHRRLSEARTAPPDARSAEVIPGPNAPRSKPGDEVLTKKYQAEADAAAAVKARAAQKQVSEAFLRWLASALLVPYCIPTIL